MCVKLYENKAKYCHYKINDKLEKISSNRSNNYLKLDNVIEGVVNGLRNKSVEEIHSFIRQNHGGLGFTGR